MRRAAMIVCLAWGCVAFAGGGPLRAADLFDRHTFAVVRQATEKEAAIPQISLADAAKLKPLSASLSSPCLLIKTDEGNYTKALVSWGYRKGPEKPIPVLLIERFVTYRADRPDLTAASGKDVILFAGFQFNFDIGQVVPAGQGADVAFDGESVLKPLDGVKLTALRGSALPADPKAARSNAASDQVAATDFAGTWKVNADGRWNGEWTIEVDEDGRASGKYLSDESKSSYDIAGLSGNAPHMMKLEIFLPAAQISADAYLWTTNRNYMAGTVSVSGRKFGFFAERVVDEPAEKAE